MSITYDELKLLFINNPYLAITKSQNLITSYTNFKTFQEFYSYNLQTPHISTCQNEWSKPQMSIHCCDCSIDSQSCICLQCFLNGNHEGHEIIVNNFSQGNCDCGDLSLIKLAGCCKEHQGLPDNSHPENYIDEKLRYILTDVVFKAAFDSFSHMQYQSQDRYSLIFQFLSSFLQFGDGFRRLIAISLTEKCKFNILLNQIIENDIQLNGIFRQFCGRLINDQLFRTYFAMATYEILLQKVIPDTFTSYFTGMNNMNYMVWNDFWFHSFCQQPIEISIEKFNWDWVTFIIQICMHIKTLLSLPKTFRNNPSLIKILHNITMNIHVAAKKQPNEQTQRFFDELFTKVLNCGNDKRKPNETIISVSFYEMHDDDKFYLESSFFNMILYHVFKCFKDKTNLKLDKLIEEIDKNLDISQIFCTFHNSFGNENDLFISKYVDKIDDISGILIDQNSMTKVTIEDHFKSFHNGGAFFYNLPLFDSILHLFKQDNLCRMKIAHLLSFKKFKKTKIKLAIVALKKLVALFCCHQNLVSKRNYSILNIIEPMLNNSTKVLNGIPLVFPVVQMLLGLQSEEEKESEFSIKEFFAFEAAREIGIYDDFNGIDYKDENIDEKQKQMIVSFLYLFILLNVERTLFDFDYYKYLEEQIIFALKQGVSSPADLNKVCDKVLNNNDNPVYFNKILSDVAKIKTNNKDGNNDVFFSLKDETKWKPISAIVPFNDQKIVINKEISKNPNSLLKIQDFIDEKDYFLDQSVKIHLKDFLFTPTVLAVIYHTLRTNDDKIDLEDHLAMNILLLISKFVDDFESKIQYDSSMIIHYDSTVFDLIQQMRKSLFNYGIDENQNATIENTLNKENFKRFLAMKIGSNQHEPKSMIDVLMSKGEIGKSLLKQFSVEVKSDGENDESSDLQTSKEMKKQRAKMIKQNIINQYKTIISNFYENETDLPVKSPSEQTNSNKKSTDEEVCSICSSTKEDELLSYPLFIYKTKFPFIVDKPPLTTVNSSTQLGVDEDKKVENNGLFGMFFGAQNQQQSSPTRMVQKRVTEGNNYVIQFSICQHHIHQSCVNNNKSFKCPIDRSTKNGFLPSIDKLPASSICDSEEVDIGTVDDKVIESITSFIDNFSDFFEDKEADLFPELAKSIGGLISTYEVRLRSLPDCLDSSKNKSLSRNLFLTAWYAYRITDKPDIESNKLTTFQRFVVKLIQCDELEGINSENRKSAVQTILSSFIGEFRNENEKRKEKQIFLFLRRVCLADYFLLDIEVDEYQNSSIFIDWDEILSVSNLSTKFDVPFSILNDEFEFKPINFVKLPKEFLRFGEKPFNFPVDQTRDMTTYNILDYNDLIKNFDDFSDIENSEENDQNIRNKLVTLNRSNLLAGLSNFASTNYPKVILNIGLKASKVEVIYEKKKIQLKPFYLDKFGCPDIGFKRGKQLFLNEEKYGRVMDLILSGDFSFYIKEDRDMYESFLEELNLNL